MSKWTENPPLSRASVMALLKLMVSWPMDWMVGSTVILVRLSLSWTGFGPHNAACSNGSFFCFPPVKPRNNKNQHRTQKKHTPKWKTAKGTLSTCSFPAPLPSAPWTADSHFGQRAGFRRSHPSCWRETKQLTRSPIVPLWGGLRKLKAPALRAPLTAPISETQDPPQKTFLEETYAATLVHPKRGPRTPTPWWISRGAEIARIDFPNWSPTEIGQPFELPLLSLSLSLSLSLFLSVLFPSRSLSLSLSLCLTLVHSVRNKPITYGKGNPNRQNQSWPSGALRKPGNSC